VGALARRAGGSDAGARRIDTLLADELLPLLSDAVLARRADDRPLVGVHVGLARDGGLDIGIDG
jgi:ATP-dependent Clp protease ATP-binding subunit ClpA